MPKYEREGYCCRCGDCCMGCHITGNPDIPCPNLRRDETGLASCTEWNQANTYWAKGCITWPTKPEHIAHLKRCTYWFREVPEDGS